MGGAVLQSLAGLILEARAQAPPVTAYRDAFLLYLGSAVVVLPATLFL